MPFSLTKAKESLRLGVFVRLADSKMLVLEINVAVCVFRHLVETIQVQLPDERFEACMTVNEWQHFIDECIPVLDDDLGALPGYHIFKASLLSDVVSLPAACC